MSLVTGSKARDLIHFNVLMLFGSQSRSCSACREWLSAMPGEAWQVLPSSRGAQAAKDPKNGAKDPKETPQEQPEKKEAQAANEEPMSPPNQADAVQRAVS